MTPLAHALVKDSLLPPKQRQHGDAMKTLRLLDGVHFFEVSEVRDPAYDLGAEIVKRKQIGPLAFLPAPRTWVEFKSPLRDGSTGRAGFLLEAHNDFAIVHRVGYFPGLPAEYFADPFLAIPLIGNPTLGRYLEIPPNDGTEYPPDVDLFVAWLYGLLAMINTPRVILRRQHMPHRGLERQLVAQRGLVGRWPLQGWSEILLKVRPPDVAESDHEAHLTGGRALHFCRQHLRIRLGRLELVTAHWRGDPALGIKQTRYRLEPA